MNWRIHRQARRLSGFTQLEALVLICVIAVGIVVLNLLYPSLGSHPPGSASVAASTVRNITNAVKQYQTEYGHLPRVAAPRNPSEKFIFVGDPAAGCVHNNGVIFDVLRATPRGPNADHALNPNRQRYFEDATSPDPKKPRRGFADGTSFPPPIQGCLFDTWGSQYGIVLQTDGAETLDISTIYRDVTQPIRRNIAAFSLGKDRKLGAEDHPGYFRRPATKEAPFDIVSWE